LGIVIGSLLDGPRLFVRRLTEPIQRVEVRPTSTDAKPERLSAFRQLQSKRPAPSRQPVRKSQAPARVEKRAPAPARKPRPEKKPPGAQRAPATPPNTPEQQAAEQVIAEIKAQQEAKVATGSGKVAQVAAYAERRAAGALASRLAKDGFDAYVSRIQKQGQEHFRVRVRPKPGSSMATVVSRLKSKGLSVWVTTE
jgi:cell division septation protein DedD